MNADIKYIDIFNDLTVEENLGYLCSVYNIDKANIQRVIDLCHLNEHKKSNTLRFKKMIDEKRSFVIVISQTYCSHCIAYKPVFNDVLKRNKINGYDNLI